MACHNLSEKIAYFKLLQCFQPSKLLKNRFLHTRNLGPIFQCRSKLWARTPPHKTSFCQNYKFELEYWKQKFTNFFSIQISTVDISKFFEYSSKNSNLAIKKTHSPDVFFIGLFFFIRFFSNYDFAKFQRF